MLSSFPWSVFRRFLYAQLAIFVPLVLVFLLLDDVRASTIFAVVSVFVLVQVFLGIRTFAPLGRLLNPADAIEEADEWFELQEAMRRKKVVSAQDFQEKDIYEASLNALYNAVLVIDIEKNVKFWNRSLSKLSQLDDLKGLHLEEVFRDPNILSLFTESLKNGEVRRQRFTFRSNGSAKVYLLTVVPLKKPEVYGAVGIFSDITDIEKTEIMRIDFVANVSHELRTPLTSMKGYAQAIESEAGDKDQAVQKYAQIISKSVDRLIHLVNDLLDLSYLESGIQLNISEVDPAEVTEHVLQQLESARTQKKQKIDIKVAVDHVRADRNRLEQVLLNLIQNAIKYTPENSHVNVDWEKSDSDVLLRVRDNGPGIDDEHLPRLFERFYRADKARSPDKGGTGLGLAIVKHIMQRHGGHVSVVSQPGKGTEFTCRFPNNLPV